MHNHTRRHLAHPRPFGPHVQHTGDVKGEPLWRSFASATLPPVVGRAPALLASPRSHTFGRIAHDPTPYTPHSGSDSESPGRRRRVPGPDEYDMNGRRRRVALAAGRGRGDGQGAATASGPSADVEHLVGTRQPSPPSAGAPKQVDSECGMMYLLCAPLDCIVRVLTLLGRVRVCTVPPPPPPRNPLYVFRTTGAYVPSAWGSKRQPCRCRCRCKWR